MTDKERAVRNTSAATDGGQPLTIKHNDIISQDSEKCNNEFSDNRRFFEELQRMSDPGYLPTISMKELFENVYCSKPPIIDGLLYPGTYLFVGAPKVGKSFLMAQLAYHVSTGTYLWGFPVKRGTVLYLALEDDYGDPPAITPEIHDIFVLMQKLKESGKAVPRMYICCGTEDRQYSSAVDLKNKADELGLSLFFEPGKPGKHDFVFFDSNMPKIMDWLLLP